MMTSHVFGRLHKLSASVIVVGAVGLSGAVSAQSPTAAPTAAVTQPTPVAAPAPAAAQAMYVRSLAATCANCHGTDGKAPQGAAVRSLAGLQAELIVSQMAAFKSGARTDATIMHQLAKGYSDAQIRAIAAYFAAQKP